MIASLWSKIHAQEDLPNMKQKYWPLHCSIQFQIWAGHVAQTGQWALGTVSLRWED